MARHTPIAQPVTNFLFAPAFGFGIRGDLFFALAIWQSGKGAASGHDAFIDVGFGHRSGSQGGTISGLDDDADRQIVFSGKLEVALIVGGHGHDSTGAVLHQNEICQINRNIVAGERISAISAGEDALFLCLSLPASSLADLSYSVDKIVYCALLRRAARECRRERMFDGKRDERCAENGVRPRGKNS